MPHVWKSYCIFTTHTRDTFVLRRCFLPVLHRYQNGYSVYTTWQRPVKSVLGLSSRELHPKPTLRADMFLVWLRYTTVDCQVVTQKLLGLGSGSYILTCVKTTTDYSLELRAEGRSAPRFLPYKENATRNRDHLPLMIENVSNLSSF